MFYLIYEFLAIKCPDPELQPSTDLTIVGVHYPMPIHYDCVLGYALNPNTTISGRERQSRSCTANGTWDNEYPLPCPHRK